MGLRRCNFNFQRADQKIQITTKYLIDMPVTNISLITLKFTSQIRESLIEIEICLKYVMLFSLNYITFNKFQLQIL